MKLSKRAFTLVETMVAALIVIIFATILIFSITTLTRLNQISTNRNSAVNIIQKSHEEVRNIASVFYDYLDTCEFPPEANNCGFEDISAAFPGFTRILDVVQTGGSTELKKIHVSVQWLEGTVAKTMDSIMYLSRPPDPLPGNIAGVVSQEGGSGGLIEGVDITATMNGSTDSRVRVSLGTLDVDGYNYTFSEESSGRDVLPAGLWHISASHPNYDDYVHPDLVNVLPSETTEVNFSMVLKPEDGEIRGRVLDAFTEVQLSSFHHGILEVYKDGVMEYTSDDSNSFSYIVEFPDSGTEELCYTVNTHDAFEVGYAYPVNSGGAPSCQFDYNREGWSSAVVGDDGSLTCPNPYNGSTDSDRICVDPGEEVDIDMPLYPVPRATITGRVVDSDGNALADATVYAYWPRNNGQGGEDWEVTGADQTATTSEDGTFVFSVPAVQEMFPEDPSQAQFTSLSISQLNLQIRARARFPIMVCCDEAGSRSLYGPMMFVGPLYDGTSGDVGDLIIPIPDDRECGNVLGLITNDFNNTPVPAVDVEIRGDHEDTDFVGNYAFECAEEGFRMPAGHYEVFVDDLEDYYDYGSRGNMWYASRPDVVIQENQITTRNAQLWPVGRGTVIVRVYHEGTEVPLSGMEVELITYDGEQHLNGVTGEDGSVTLYNVLETWPPPAISPDDTYYRHETRFHVLTVEDPSDVYFPETIEASEIDAYETVEIIVNLVKKGGV